MCPHTDPTTKVHDLLKICPVGSTGLDDAIGEAVGQVLEERLQAGLQWTTEVRYAVQLDPDAALDLESINGRVVVQNHPWGMAGAALPPKRLGAVPE